MSRTLWLTLAVGGLLLALGIMYYRDPLSRQVRPFSPYTLLTSSWEKYKIRFINSDGRVIDYSQGGITTSEGQSYALLQAVWMDDKPTFDQVWSWTKNNLRRIPDNLFGWRWGHLTGTQYGLLPGGGENSASDADTDVALALILASRRWQNQAYLQAALPIIQDIWVRETDEIHYTRYMVAGSWAIGNDRSIINPSYFSPYAWRIFATVDREHDWISLVKPAYQLLQTASHTELQGQQAVGLPPDWLALKKPEGTIMVADAPNLTPNYSFDAMRIPWRIALDYAWNRAPEAKAYLASLAYLGNVYTNLGQLPMGFSHAGQPLERAENPAMYATVLGYFMVTNPHEAQTIYQQKILQMYSNDTNSFRDDLPYYEENWLWFGSALYLHYLNPLG